MNIGKLSIDIIQINQVRALVSPSRHIGLLVTMICFQLFISCTSAAAKESANSEKAYMVNGRMIGSQQYEGVLLYQEGVRLLQSNSNREALDKLQKAEELFPDFAPIQHNLGIALAKTGQPEKAIEALTKARELDPAQDATWMSLAGMYQTQGRIDEAISTYKDFLARFPTARDRQKVESLVIGLEKEQAVRVANGAENSGSSSYVADDYFKEITRDGLLRWKKERMPLRVKIESGEGVEGFLPEYGELLQRSFKDWESASNGLVSFQFVDDATQSDIICSWTNDASTFKNSAEAGETRFISGKSGILKATIKLLTVPLMKEVPLTANRMRSICLHEIGHVMGMAGHTTNPQDALFYSLGVTDQWRDLTARDAATIRRLYMSD